MMQTERSLLGVFAFSPDPVWNILGLAMLPRCRVLFIFCLSMVLSFSGALELVSLYRILVPFHLQPAVCTIKSAQPLAQYMSLANHCNPAHHGEDWKAMCGFWSVTPGWQAEVTLLSRYKEVRSSVDDVSAGLEEPHADTASTTPLRRHALHEAHTRPWNATAIPPLHSESASARKRHGLVTKGACSGQTLLGREDTIDMCLHRRAEWMPMVTMNSTYPCHVERYGDPNVWMEAAIQPLPLALSLLSALLALVLGLLLCCCACMLQSYLPQHSPPRRHSLPGEGRDGRSKGPGDVSLANRCQADGRGPGHGPAPQLHDVDNAAHAHSAMSLAGHARNPSSIEGTELSDGSADDIFQEVSPRALARLKSAARRARCATLDSARQHLPTRLTTRPSSDESSPDSAARNSR